MYFKLAHDGTAKTSWITGSPRAALRGPAYESMRCYAEVASKVVGSGGATRIG
jgi:hypothetical protein